MSKCELFTTKCFFPFAYTIKINNGLCSFNLMNISVFKIYEIEKYGQKERGVVGFGLGLLEQSKKFRRMVRF